MWSNNALAYKILQPLLILSLLSKCPFSTIHILVEEGNLVWFCNLFYSGQCWMRVSVFVFWHIVIQLQLECFALGLRIAKLQQSRRRWKTNDGMHRAVTASQPLQVGANLRRGNAKPSEWQGLDQRPTNWNERREALTMR